MADAKTVGVITFLRAGKDILFLILRSATKGGWSPPKGNMDEGETEMETAARELFEETGLRRLSYVPGFRESFLCSVEKKDRVIIKEMVFYLGEMESDEVQLSPEHSEVHFGTIDEIETMIHRADVKVVFRKAYETLINVKPDF